LSQKAKNNKYLMLRRNKLIIQIIFLKKKSKTKKIFIMQITKSLRLIFRRNLFYIRKMISLKVRDALIILEIFKSKLRQ